MSELKKTLKPEFLNRIDEIIVFHPLNREDLSKIVELEVQKVRSRLTPKGYGLELTDKAKEFLINRGYDPVYGARPLRRAIQRYVEDPVSEELLKGKMTSGQKLMVDLEGDHLTFQWV
jgi:ATP-dependent Clp protease ATP-binding subunit ClpC